MDVILLERVGRLGRMGDTVKVKDGFARNFLLPNHKALRATEANKAKFERDRAVLEVKNNDSRGIAEAEAESLKGKSFVVIRQAGESGQLYGSVSTRDISEAALAAGAHVDKNHVHLRAPIKAIGMHEVELTLHPEVVVKLQVNVARSAAEADAQARGEVMTGNAAERAEVRAAAEALFEEAQADEAAEEAAEDAAPVSKTRAKAKAKKADIE